MAFGWPRVPVNQKSVEKKLGGGVGNEAWAAAVICRENYDWEEGPIFWGCLPQAGLGQCCGPSSVPCHRNLCFLKEKAATCRQSINMCTCGQEKQNRTGPQATSGPIADTVEPLNCITSSHLCLLYPSYLYLIPWSSHHNINFFKYIY